MLQICNKRSRPTNDDIILFRITQKTYCTFFFLHLLFLVERLPVRLSPAEFKVRETVFLQFVVQLQRKTRTRYVNPTCYVCF